MTRLWAAAEGIDWLAIVYSPHVWAMALTAVGLWLMLPRRGTRGWNAGVVLLAIAAGCEAAVLPQLVGWLDQTVFAVLAIVTLAAGVGTVTSRNPIYCALWFGLALLGTAGLMFYQGAQFIGLATIVVYAGAILVTFLFVIMLAQPEGHAFYDRVSWDASLSAAVGGILVGLLSVTIAQASGQPGWAEELLPQAGSSTPNEQPSVSPATTNVAAATAEAATQREGVFAEQHVASLGSQLVGKHMVSMQAAAALMLAALVGAVGMVARGKDTFGEDLGERDDPGSIGRGLDA